MRVIHFTRNATDFLETFHAQGTCFVPLAAAEGEARVSCLHLSPGAEVREPPTIRDCALLVVHGSLIVRAEGCAYALIELSGGVGATLKAGERYRLESPTGAIVFAIESQRLVPTRHGISTPGRIMGATWPCDKCLSAVNDNCRLASPLPLTTARCLPDAASR